jgi:hypothetical protein
VPPVDFIFFRLFESKANARLAQKTRESDYPFDLHVSELDHPCESIIQVTATRIPTGAIKRTITYREDFSEQYIDQPIFEEGGVLVASKSISGHVAIIVHPRKSERLIPNEEQIILYERLDPTDVTNKLLEKSIRRYLLYIRSTSLCGHYDALSMSEKLTIVLMKIGDIRYRYMLSRSLLSMKNEWAKIIFVTIIGWAIGYNSSYGK